MNQKINDQQGSNNTLHGTSNIYKQTQPIQNEPPTLEKRSPNQPNTALQNNAEQTQHENKS